MHSTDLSPEARTVVERGQEAWNAMKRDESWERWLAVGRAIEAGRSETMRYLRTNNPTGRVWSEHFGAWLKEAGFDQVEKSARSRLQSCLDNLPAVEAWRGTLSLGERLSYNHPNTVWRKFQAASKPPKEAGEPKEKAPSAIEAATQRLTEAAESFSDRVEEGAAGIGLDLSDIDAAAAIFVDYHGAEAAEAFARAILREWVTRPVEAGDGATTAIGPAAPLVMFDPMLEVPAPMAAGRAAAGDDYGDDDPAMLAVDAITEAEAEAEARPFAGEITVDGKLYLIGHDVRVAKRSKLGRMYWQTVSDQRRIAKIRKTAEAAR